MPPKIEEFNPLDVFDPMDDSPLFEDGIAIVTKREKLNSQDAFIQTAKIFAPIGVGLILIVFGLTSTGSYFTPMGKFAGVLADIFYGWQAGTFLAMVGSILIYDAIKRTGYL
jgi:hypothetical protein